MTIKVEREAQNIIQPGSIVEWLKAKGIWIVQATTGIVAKIRDSYGKEVLVSESEPNKVQPKCGLRGSRQFHFLAPFATTVDKHYAENGSLQMLPPIQMCQTGLS